MRNRLRVRPAALAPRGLLPQPPSADGAPGPPPAVRQGWTPPAGRPRCGPGRLPGDGAAAPAPVPAAVPWPDRVVPGGESCRATTGSPCRPGWRQSAAAAG